MNKKGQIFTIMTIAIIMLFIVTYEVYSFSQNREAISKRVSTMESFIFSTETNLERDIYIFGFRSIFLAEDRITKTGLYIPNTSTFFEEAFFNGSIYGNSSEVLEGAKYSDIVSTLSERAERTNMEIEITNPSINVSQQDPWNLLFTFSFDAKLKDKSDLAYWNKTEKISAKVSIEGFEDPLYIVNTNSKVINKINKTVYTPFSTESPANLLSHFNGNYYLENNDAPSFLNRLGGILAPNENGIESLVVPMELSVQGIEIKEKCIADHIYFSDYNPESYRIAGMPEGFRLDSSHTAYYKATAS